MTFKARPKAKLLRPRTTDATLVRTVLTGPVIATTAQPDGARQPEWSPFRWTEIVSGAIKLEGVTTAHVPYLKQRLSRGLRQMIAIGEVEQVGRGLYRLTPTSLPVPILLSKLADRAEKLTRALEAGSTVKPWVAVNEWYALRDRFKDTALAVERELLRAGRKLELPTAVRAVEGDGQPANRRFEVRFQGRMIEGIDESTKEFIERAQDSGLSRAPERPDRMTVLIVRPPAGQASRKAAGVPSGSALGAPPSSRSKPRRTPSRRRAA